MFDGLKGRGLLILIGLIGLAVYWFSNQASVGYTDRKQVRTTSIEQENKLGEQAYVQLLAEAGGDVACSRADNACTTADREFVDTVRRIGNDLRIAAISYEEELLQQGYDIEPKARGFDWQFNVIKSSPPNAFCLPGGYVAVYTGILDVTGNFDGTVTADDVSDPAMLAVVMGHEIAHALARHGGERMSQGRIMQIGQLVVGAASGDGRVMRAFGLAAQTGVLLPFSRQHESEADRIGLELLVRACYDPRQAPELWERMGELGGGQAPPEFMSTHPASARRAENFRKWMPSSFASYEQNCGPLK